MGLAQAEAEAKARAQAQDANANVNANQGAGAGWKREPFGELEVDGRDFKRVRLGQS